MVGKINNVPLYYPIIIRPTWLAACSDEVDSAAGEVKATAVKTLLDMKPPTSTNGLFANVPRNFWSWDLGAK